MNIATFQRKRLEALESAPVYRQLCLTCMQPDFSCFCTWLKPFNCKIEFIILTHPIEFQRRIATGRMSHLSLKNSRLIVGHDYTKNKELNQLLADPGLHCVMLYPGRLASNLTPMSRQERSDLIPPRKRLAVIVIDGTWSTARKMVHLSQNLKTVPRVCFTPPSPSNFRVRQQPRAECYSTIEAIHHTIDLLGPSCGFATEARKHDSLLYVFDQMVNRQLELAHCGRPSRRKYY